MKFHFLIFFAIVLTYFFGLYVHFYGNAVIYKIFI